MQEEAKLLPFGEVWKEYLKVCGIKGGIDAFKEIEEYEKAVKTAFFLLTEIWKNYIITI